MKTKLILAAAFAFAVGAGARAASPKTPVVKNIKITGHPGMIIDKVISQRIMTEDVETLVNVFATKKETHAWQSEFWGKWTIGACGLYEYTHDENLYQRIKKSAEDIMKLQEKSGYIGNYAPDSQLKEWDIWGRKYVILGLLSWYDISKDKKAVTAACRQLDFLTAQLKEKNLLLVETGNYRGMPSASILNAVVKLYNITGNKKYLKLSEDIAAEIESSKGPQILAKTLQNIPLANRFPHEGSWYNYSNGQKAYEMMSCLQGMLDLYRVNNDKKLLDGVTKVVDMIVAQEINITGSGSARECWYGGRKVQTRPAIYENETCVTVTWINLLRRMLQISGDARYADLMEQCIYNALFASLKVDASQIDKYTPLEGERTIGEEQCGLHINCCNANGPRGFAAIPQTIYNVGSGVLDVNFYMPSQATVSLGGKVGDVGIAQSGDYPRTDEMEIKISLKTSSDFTVRLRIPEWGKATAVSVNGEKVAGTAEKGYLSLNRKWNNGDVVKIKFDMPARLVKQNDCDAVVRGPIVLARDSRFKSGDVDEVVNIPNKNGIVDIKPSTAPGWAWMSFKVPVILGVDYIDYGKPVEVDFCDFASAGNSWVHGERYRVWLPEAYDNETK